MIVTVNKKVACSVPEQTGRQTKTTNGFGTVEHKDGGLMALKVIFGTDKTPDLDGKEVIVYLAEQDKQQAWASVVYKLGDKSFILVPEDRILLMEAKD